ELHGSTLYSVLTKRTPTHVTWFAREHVIVLIQCLSDDSAFIQISSFCRVVKIIGKKSYAIEYGSNYL
ncbi:unnamed protein product, partial [Larinioides sclopetarius]